MTKFELMMTILLSIHLVLELAIIGTLGRIADRGEEVLVRVARLYLTKKEGDEND